MSSGQTQDFFSTQFLSPNRFRFDYLSPHPHKDLQFATTYHMVAYDGVDAFTYMRPFNGSTIVTREKSLSAALASMAGISRCAIYSVATMLLDRIEGPSFLDLESLRFDSDITLGDIVCYQLVGTRDSIQFGIAIDKHSLMIRRVSMMDQEFESHELRFGIIANQAINDSIFRPPFEETRGLKGPG